jgi:membrane protease YdiL (CAAX protease family)
VLSRQARWRRLVVLSCFGLTGIHVAVLVSVRAIETEEELEGVSGDWKALSAYSAYVAHFRRMELAEAVAAAETVCAMAPGAPIGFKAAADEATLLWASGRLQLGSRVLQRELSRPEWPSGEPARRLARFAVRSYYTAGMTAQEREVCERAIDELQPFQRSFFHQRLAVLFEADGDPRKVLKQFDRGVRTGSPGQLYREAILAASRAQRALGNIESSEGLAEVAKSDTGVLSFERRLRLPPAPEDNPLAAGLTAELVGAQQPKPNAWAVLNADLDTAGLWIGVSLALLVLTWMPVERFANTPARQAAGATLLCLTGLVAYAPQGSAWGCFFYGAPLSNPRVVLGWASVLLAGTLFGALLAVTVVEGQSLRALGWRAGKRLWLYVPLGALLGVVFVSGAFDWMAGHAGEGKQWLPRLAAISVLMALVAAFVEETLFRGYLLGALIRLQSRFWVANLIQAAVFAGIHVARYGPRGASTEIGLHGMALWWLIFSLLDGWLTRKSGSLWPAFAFHFIFDAIAIYARIMPGYEMLQIGAELL